ncbi:hypothetical protein Dxin01_01698 [Deinococcus xinjiangensis]|uniref:Uncharacterized protein n=1 Tax=Deinococcus xinjiangensis TaxID=457454 RepID=A0ABP9V9L0_9DEIO
MGQWNVGKSVWRVACSVWKKMIVERRSWIVGKDGVGRGF